MANTAELNAFFPLNHLTPQGWLNDFITPQIMREKKSLEYSLLYLPFNQLNDDTKRLIQTQLEKKSKDFFLSYKAVNKFKFDSEEKFIYISGKYTDKLENNIMAKTFAAATSPTENKDYLKLLNGIKPYQIAFLQPYVKLYYGFKKDPKNKDEDFTFVEFPFSQYFDLETILDKSNNAFLEGSGIKNVTNNIQFNVGTKVNAQISISYFFSNMNILTRELTHPNGIEMPYGFSFQKLFANLGAKKEVLKLEYGYQIDPQLTDQHHISRNMCDLINRFETNSFLLNKVGHNFRFTNEGSVEITTNYYNMFEAKMFSSNTVAIPSPNNNKNSKILQSVIVESPAAGKLLEEYQVLKSTYEDLDEKIKNITQTKFNEPTDTSRTSQQEVQNAQDRRRANIEYYRKKLQETNQDLVQTKRQLIPYFKDLLINKITDNLDLYSIAFNNTKEETGDDIIYSFKGTFNLLDFDGREVEISKIIDKTYKLSDIVQVVDVPPKVRQKMSGITNRLFNSQINKKQTTKNGNHIIFFPARALIRAAYELLSPEEQREIPYILFGNFTSRIYDNNFYVNAGNVLIEINTFQKWMFDKFYSKNSIDFSFGEFIKELIDDLIPEALYRNKTHPQDSTRLTIQDYSPLFSIKKDFIQTKKTEDGILLKTALEVRANDSDLNSLQDGISYANSDTKNYDPLIIYAKMDLPTMKEVTTNTFSITQQDLNLNEEQDAGHGIPHIIIGADGGMFMNVDFNQIDMKGLRTGIALQAITDQNSSYFFYNYSIKANVIGSSIFKFGSMVAIPSPPLGLVGAQYDIGIVGYYKIKDLSVSISPTDGYKASISGDWFFNPRSGKHGNPHSSNDVKKVPQSLALDYVPISVLDPINYIKLLLKKDMSTLTNFGIISSKQDVGTKKTDKSPPLKKTQKDEKEPDV